MIFLLNHRNTVYKKVVYAYSKSHVFLTSPTLLFAWPFQINKNPATRITAQFEIMLISYLISGFLFQLFILYLYNIYCSHKLFMYFQYVLVPPLNISHKCDIIKKEQPPTRGWHSYLMNIENTTLSLGQSFGVVFLCVKHYLLNVKTNVSNARMNIPKAIRSLKSNGFLSISTTPILCKIKWRSYHPVTRLLLSCDSSILF